MTRYTDIFKEEIHGAGDMNAAVVAEKELEGLKISKAAMKATTAVSVIATKTGSGGLTLSMTATTGAKYKIKEKGILYNTSYAQSSALVKNPQPMVTTFEPTEKNPTVFIKDRGYGASFRAYVVITNGATEEIVYSEITKKTSEEMA